MEPPPPPPLFSPPPFSFQKSFSSPPQPPTLPRTSSPPVPSCFPFSDEIKCISQAQEIELVNDCCRLVKEIPACGVCVCVCVWVRVCVKDKKGHLAGYAPPCFVLLALLLLALQRLQSFLPRAQPLGKNWGTRLRNEGPFTHLQPVWNWMKFRPIRKKMKEKGKNGRFASQQNIGFFTGLFFFSLQQSYLLFHLENVGH